MKYTVRIPVFVGKDNGEGLERQHYLVIPVEAIFSEDAVNIVTDRLKDLLDDEY